MGDQHIPILPSPVERSRGRLLLGITLAVLALGAVFASTSNAYVYWANLTFPSGTGTTIGRANLNGTAVDQGFIDGPATNPCGVAVNSTHVFWQNSGSDTIGRANIDGTSGQEDFIELSRHNCGVAVNGTHIFWAAEDFIGRANLNGTGVNEDFIPTATTNTCGVAVDAGHVYWVNSNATIGRANLNGTGIDQGFIDTQINGGACGVDVDAAHLYWGNQNAIGRADLAGSNVEGQFIPGPNAQTPVSHGNFIYWVNSDSAIGRANLNGTGVNQSFITGADHPVGIAVDDLPTDDPEPEPPSNDFTLGAVERNKKKGTAILTVTVPGPGTLDLSGKGLKPQRPAGPVSGRPYEKPVAAAGDVPLKIKAKGKKKKKLKKKGKLKLNAIVTYTPTGGTAATQTKTVKLKKKKKKGKG